MESTIISETLRNHSIIEIRNQLHRRGFEGRVFLWPDFEEGAGDRRRLRAVPGVVVIPRRSGSSRADRFRYAEVTRVLVDTEEAKMDKSKILKGVAATFVTLIWPWVVKNIWPHIEKMILEIITDVFEDLIEKIQEIFEKRRKGNQDEAHQKANRAEEQAANTADPVEAARLRAIAQVWREAAEQFRKENEELRAEIDKLTGKAKKDLTAGVEKLPIGTLVQKDKHGALRLKGSSEPLAELPAPQSAENIPA